MRKKKKLLVIKLMLGNFAKDLLGFVLEIDVSLVVQRNQKKLKRKILRPILLLTDIPQFASTDGVIQEYYH
jgi:hypothetical protein